MNNHLDVLMHKLVSATICFALVGTRQIIIFSLFLLE